MKMWKRISDGENDILQINSPYETLGFSKEKNYIQVSSLLNKFLIKMYDFRAIEQISDIKRQLSNNKILIIDAKEVLESNKIEIQELEQGMNEIKTFLNNHGGSIGRIGDQYLILTPNSSIKIANY